MILTFLDRVQRTSDCFSFIFSPQNPVSWKAGQYMQFTLQHENPDNRGINRFFTISSAPHEKNIMITTRYEFDKSSTFKKALFSMKKDDNISAFMPQGDFIIEDFSKSYVFIAGGIGITPYRSIIMDVEDKGKIDDLEIYLLYSNRNNEIVFKDDFDSLANKYKTFRVRYVISPERSGLDLIKVAVPDYIKKVYYLSGPPGMVKSIEEEIIAEGNIPESLIKLDYFPGY